MKKSLFILFILICQPMFSQIKIFGTTDAPEDETTVTNTTAVTTRWIRMFNVHNLIGQASLFVAGDLQTGSHSEGMKVEMQLGCCITSGGDTLTGDFQTLETVPTSYLALTFGGGTQITGRHLSIGNLAGTWNKFYMIRFRVSFATSTHTTKVLGYMTIN